MCNKISKILCVSKRALCDVAHRDIENSDVRMTWNLSKEIREDLKQEGYS